MAIQSKTKTPSDAVIRELMTYVADLTDYIPVVPFAVACGIIWQESKWDPTSYRYNETNALDRSYGLMHLTLPTANWISRTYYSKPLTKKDIYDPIMNIWLGLTYLQFLSDKYNGNVDDIISAFNAGHSLRQPSGKFGNQSYLTAIYNAAGQYQV